MAMQTEAIFNAQPDLKMTHKFAILYVDDEDSNLRIFQKTFRREYDVFIANSAKAGLEILEKEKIDLIFSDQKMPQMTGVEFFKTTVTRYPHINRILITGYTDFEALKDAINEAKIFQYIQKPWVESDLKYIIENALKVYKLEQELLDYHNNLEKMVNERTKELEHANKILLANQLQIENQSKAILEQSDEIKTYAENIKTANAQLLEKQALVELQKKLLEKNNQQLILINSTKDRFFSIIGHDLRNPFHTISSFAELLIENFEKLPSEKIQRFHSLILSTSKQGYELLENLLIWSHSQTGQIVYEPTSMNLFIVVEGIFALLNGKAMGKNILMENKIDPSTLINADKNMLSTILRNLISNAIKFTPQEGKICVSASENKEYIEVSVTDTGVGIEEKYIPLLFRIDSKYSTPGTNNETGTGLGLILCREFVEKHKGKIWVESEINKGSRFIFTLPKNIFV